MSSQLWPESASELFSEGLYIAQLFLKIQLLHPEIQIPLWPNSNCVVVTIVGFLLLGFPASFLWSEPVMTGFQRHYC